MVQYKLAYFNARGRGEVIRLIFEVSNQKYEDYRVEFAQWSELKSKTPFGKMPFLEINDNGNVTYLAQSASIARYLARKFDLAGKNELESAELDMYVDQINDLLNELVPTFFEKDENRLKTIKDKFFNETLPNNLKIFNERLGKNSSGFFAPSGLSWADLYLYCFLEYFGDKKDACIANFKNVKALVDKISAHPNVAAWLAKRPKTER